MITETTKNGSGAQPMNRETMSGDAMLPKGLTGGFHYGTIYAPCNGVLHTTDRQHSDGRQIYECDACGAECLRNRVRQGFYSNLKSVTGPQADQEGEGDE